MFEFDTSTYHPKSRRPGQARLEQRIRQICQMRVRDDCRRIHVLPRLEGFAVNAKGVYRLFREIGLKLANKSPRRWSSQDAG